MTKPASLQNQHIGAARRRLGHLAGLAAKTRATEERILEVAEHRLAAVDADLAKLRPRVNLDEAAADSYQALTTERGHLTMVLSRARAVLNP